MLFDFTTQLPTDSSQFDVCIFGSGPAGITGPERRFDKFRLRCLVEQSPDRSNRVMLQEQTDTFGQRKLKVVWGWNELDLRSIRQAQRAGRLTPGTTIQTGLSQLKAADRSPLTLGKP
jgi:hypothetical protein